MPGQAGHYDLICAYGRVMKFTAINNGCAHRELASKMKVKLTTWLPIIFFKNRTLIKWLAPHGSEFVKQCSSAYLQTGGNAVYWKGVTVMLSNEETLHKHVKINGRGLI